MNPTFCLLLPSFFGLKFYMLITKEENKITLLINYLVMVLFSNAIILGLVKFMNSFDSNIELYLTEHSFFAFKFLLIAAVINMVLAFLISIIEKSVSFSLEITEKKEEKNEKKNSKKRN